MSVLHSDGGGFFIAPGLGYNMEWDEEDSVDHQLLILQKADALASENHLKEALDLFSAAIRYGPVKPEQLSTLVDCILRKFKATHASNPTDNNNTHSKKDSSADQNPSDIFCCPGCHRLLSEPLTVSCGHTYCKRCLQGDLFSKCKLCSNDMAGRAEMPLLRPNVILSNVLEKCYPSETKIFKVISKVEDLSRKRLFEEGLALSNSIIESDPGDALARMCRAEVYAGLKQYKSALKDLEELCAALPDWPEVYYRKGKILQEMNCSNDSLQVFLQCLALDEDFMPAKQEVEKIVYDLVSPVCENVKAGLQETALSSSPYMRSKGLVSEAQGQAPPDTHTYHKEECDVLSQLENVEHSGLSRAFSLRVHGRLGGSVPEEGLKRVSSAPQLGDQDKGVMLKRKLSVCEAGPSVINSGGNKHKKQVDVMVAGNCTPAPCREVPAELLEASDLECPLCMRLFYQPVTTPCGHTFCKSCLERCLDHMSQCPLCKESLKEYLASRQYSITEVLDGLIKNYLPEEHLERHKTHTEETEELSDLTKNVPMFVCTMAYPTVPCPLHVFEPRYRLMIRRCMETGTKRFGMCIHDAQKGFADYGCMLQIRSVHFLPDGRSVVDTIGWKRFQVLSRGMKDGYNTADIEYLEDVKVNNVKGLLKLQELHDQVYEQACSWFQSLKNHFRGQILQHFGPMPEQETDLQVTPNGPAWCWWLLAVLPVDPRYQLSVLSMMSLKERLVKIQQILTYLQSIPNE